MNGRIGLSSCFGICLLLASCWNSNWSEVLAAQTPHQMQTLQEIEKGISGGPPKQSALKKLEALLDEDPDNCQARILLGTYYEWLSLRDQAEEEYQHAARNLPRDHDQALSLIRSQVQSGRIHAAGELLAVARKRFPNDPQLCFWQGNFFKSEKEMEKAAVSYSDGLRENEKILGLPTALAEVRLAQQRYMEAATLAQTDINHDPGFWPAYKIRGAADLQMGNLTGAVRTLTIAYKNLPYKTGAAGPLALALYRTGQYEMALPPALVNLALNSANEENSMHPKELIGNVLKHLHPQDADAILIKTEGTPEFPKESPYHLAMGELLDGQELYAMAIREYQRALRLKPDNTRALFRLGHDLELHYHNYEDALKYYREAHKIDVTDQEITLNLIRLEQRMRMRRTDFSWQLKDFLQPTEK